MKIRFGYCPSNPGWKSRRLKYIRWYNDPKSAVEAYNGHYSIWAQISGIYREITFEELVELARD